MTVFKWRREEPGGGSWYYSPDLDMECWRCPALFNYFEKAPEKIYAKFEAKG